MAGSGATTTPAISKLRALFESPSLANCCYKSDNSQHIVAMATIMLLWQPGESSCLGVRQWGEFSRGHWVSLIMNYCALMGGVWGWGWQLEEPNEGGSLMIGAEVLIWPLSSCTITDSPTCAFKFIFSPPNNQIFSLIVKLAENESE